MALYADLALLDPKNFDQIMANTIDLLQTALQELSKCLVKFDSTATETNLQSKLSSLAEQWPRLKRSTFDKYTIRTTDDVPEGDNGEESWLSCKNCPVCCNCILSQYNLLTNAYPILGLSYKFLLTLSVTQVSCEQSFSTLKFIKCRLKSSLTKQHQDVFILMALQKCLNGLG